MPIVGVEALANQSVGFEFNPVFHLFPKMVLLSVEHFTPKHAFEIGIKATSGITDSFHKADNVFRGCFGDFVIVLEFADNVSTAIAAYIQGARIFESSPAVVRPNRHVVDVRCSLNDLGKHLRIMVQDDWMGSCQIIARAKTPKGVIHSSSPEHWEFL